jgi:nucleoside-diphosphate-sugar epimerase
MGSGRHGAPGHRRAPSQPGFHESRCALIRTIFELEERLATPSAALVADMARLDGDILVLGAGGKMGPSLVALACNAIQAAGSGQRVVAVSRFGDPSVRAALEAAGADTIALDLLDPGALEQLPDAKNVVYMAAVKFGTSGQEHLTWAQNAFLPGLVGRRFADARIMSFSSGNVYPLVSVASGGCQETDPPGPIGEYAQSVLGRERMFEYAAHRYGTRSLLLRLNYAVELRYGTLVDLALAIRDQTPIDLSMGHMNVIWQGDANEIALRSLALVAAPPTILNVTGPETVSVRRVAGLLGRRLGREPVLFGEEEPTALLANAGRAHARFGYPRVTLEQMVDWVADWVASGGATYGKPTKFGVRSGRF